MKYTYSDNGPKCPCCNYVHNDLDGQQYNQDGFELECWNCKKLFFVIPRCSWEWECHDEGEPA